MNEISAMWRILLFLVGLAATSSLSAQDLELRHTLACRAEHLAFSLDGKTLASVSGSGPIKLWDTTTGQTTASLSGHADKVVSVAFSSDGKMLALGTGLAKMGVGAEGRRWACRDGEGPRY